MEGRLKETHFISNMSVEGEEEQGHFVFKFIFIHLELMERLKFEDILPKKIATTEPSVYVPGTKPFPWSCIDICEFDWTEF